jgi:ATP-dependent DNA helicase RecG
MDALTQLANIPLAALDGVGPSVASKLEKLQLYTVQDLLFHLPIRYEDRTRVTRIRDLLAGMHTNVVGHITQNQIVQGKRRMLVVTLSDGSGLISLRFFHFTAALQKSLAVGRALRCFGEVKRGPRGAEMLHPEYKTLDDINTPITVAESLTPVYPTTDGLKQASLRKLTDKALQRLAGARVQELLPEPFRVNDYSLADALTFVHRPPPDVSIELLEQGRHPAQLRLITEELLAHHVSLLRVKLQHQHHQAKAFHVDTTIEQQFLAQLPFTPTAAQQRVVHEIRTDLQQYTPMMRLVQGDVGSGKTLVAALTALTVISQQSQVALMAPTEILAEQHWLTFQRWFEPLGIEVAWLAGKTKVKQKRETLERLAQGKIQLLVGTHALFQQDVIFHQLGLIIIDEQHRFGVHQRLQLREKGRQQQHYPHQLIMTATPIPRTLAMTAYADLDTSIIDELPPGRTPVTTVAIPDTRREEVIERIRTACQHERRQVYWVCTLIEESEVLQCQAAEDSASYLQQQLAPLTVGLVHGKMKADEKQRVMSNFKAGEIDLLVATTVIEVGVDVPNASLMIIENPERLGLAQLHQLRGRVGRGAVASHCVLLYKAPLSKTASKRLAVLRESNDGFYIAEQDLKIRGPGELLGTKQTGLAELKIADLSRDGELIALVQQQAYQLINQHAACIEPLIKRWLGNKAQYAKA